MTAMQSESLLDWAGPIATGALTTVQIAVLAYALGLLLGLIGAGAKLSPLAPLRALATGYSTLIRAVPELLLIILLYYAGGDAIEWLLARVGLDSHIEISGFATAVGVLAFVQGAYMTEVFRGAIVAIPSGQIEAADAFGFSRWTRFHRIVLPGMWPNALPGLSNLWLILIKDTALISVIGFNELFFTIQQAAASSRAHFVFYAAAGVIYLLMTMTSTAIFQRLERHVRRGEV